MKPIYLCNPVRTPIGAFQGALSPFFAAELGSKIILGLIQKASLDANQIDELIMGNVLSAGQGQNIARQIALGAGIPNEKTAMSINMVCGSGLRAVCLAAQAVQCQDANIVVAGGAESMTNAAYVLPKARAGYRMGHGQLIDTMVSDGLWDCFNDYHMGITAENLAEKYNISRDDQDAFAAESQQKAEAAMKANRFADEIIPIDIPQRKKDPIHFDQDEYPRAGMTKESLGKLKPVFKKDGTVTAANASGVNDGAAAVIVVSESAINENNLKPMGRIVSYAYHGTDPAIMGIGPVQAVKKALAKANWKIDDLDLIEANEAFAVQTLAVSKELGWDMSKVNVNGGAIALGHPIGASGARILVTLLHEMQKRDAKKGLATLCIGGGMGIAMCVER